MMPAERKIAVSVLLPTKDEGVNLYKCLDALSPALNVYVLDSHSTDDTIPIAEKFGAHVVQFDYKGGYPKKRQWAMDNLPVDTQWILLVDADEVISKALWHEIDQVLRYPDPCSAYILVKSFHFLGSAFKYGGFSFGAITLFQKGKAHFETIIDDDINGLDMEVHERILVNGRVGKLKNPIIHQDFKNLEAYIARHNKYSTWEAKLRYQYLKTGKYGDQTVRRNLFGNTQERRRFLKTIAIRTPFEPLGWFLYHYILRLGFLEGRPGLIACLIRALYIIQVRAKIYELSLSSHHADKIF